MPDENNNSPSLPLVAIEHYMLADDRPDYPMVFYIRLTLDGRLDRRAFERAVETAVARHPLLHANLGPAQGRRRSWTWEQNCKPTIDWNEGDQTPAAQIDLTREAGLRLKVEERGAETILLLAFHHSCTDGLGGLAFTEDMLSAYAEACRAQRDGSPLADAATAKVTARITPDAALLKRLAGRGRFGLRLPGLLLRSPLELLGALGTIEFFSHRPTPLYGTLNEATQCAAWPEECTHEFSAEQTKGLRAAAAECGGTLNDLLARDMFLAAGEWIDRHSPEHHGKHVRVMVPVNLRTRRDHDLPAANVVAMINLDRRPHRWHNLRRMLRVLHWEMTAVKRARLGLTFIRGIQLVHYGLNMLTRLMPAHKCMASCVLSNLGEPWRKSPLADSAGRVVAGNVTLRRFDMLPPIRPLTHVALGVISYQGRLNLAMNYDRSSLTPAEAQELLATFVGRLETSLEAGGVREPEAQTAAQ